MSRRSGGKSPGFIDSVLGLTDEFYVGLVQNLKPWRPSVPRKEAGLGRSADGVAGAGEEIPAEVLAELGAADAGEDNGARGDQSARATHDAGAPADTNISAALLADA